MRNIAGLSALAVLALILGTAGRSEAAPITYAETATGVSGSLNGTAFSGAVLTLSATNDTASIVNSGNLYTISNTSLVGSISGFAGAFTFTDVTQVASNQSFSRGGFGDLTNGFAILFTQAQAFASYDLSTSIGPITGTPVFNGGQGFSTSSGSLVLNNIGGVTFQATGGIATVPEPSSLALCGIAGLSGLGYAWRRRRIATA